MMITTVIFVFLLPIRGYVAQSKVDYHFSPDLLHFRMYLKLIWDTYFDYIYDSYVGIEYNVTQYKTIKNTLLKLYYLSIGENIEDHLIELFTERNYILNVLHYPLDLSDYIEDIDDIDEKSEQIKPKISFIETDLDTQNHDMSIYDSINNLVPYNYIIKKTNIKNNYKLLEYIKECCIIFNYDYNTISEWKLEVPDDFTKYR